MSLWEIRVPVFRSDVDLLECVVSMGWVRYLVWRFLCWYGWLISIVAICWYVVRLAGVGFVIL